MNKTAQFFSKLPQHPPQISTFWIHRHFVFHGPPQTNKQNDAKCGIKLSSFLMRSWNRYSYITLLLAMYILFISTCISNSHRQVQGQSATSVQSNVVLPFGDPPSGHVTLRPKSFPPWQVGSPNQNFKILQLCNRVGQWNSLWKFGRPKLSLSKTAGHLGLNKFMSWDPTCSHADSTHVVENVSMHPLEKHAKLPGKNMDSL